ncbi:MAG: hypothetical protein E7449_03815 [Ruminococcaceae bacterium]|nr:hypothetical protein [Oscillospiraceae bacterium]
MKIRWILTFIFTVALGSAMHFFYDWLPIPLVGLFAPINESVWEHLKLLFWPFLIGCIFLQRTSKNRQAFWGAALAASLVMPLFLTGMYYLLNGGFMVESLPVDLALYALTMLLGFVLLSSWKDKLWAEKALGILILVAGLYGACLILFSIAAPDFPIFTPPQGEKTAKILGIYR